MGCGDRTRARAGDDDGVPCVVDGGPGPRPAALAQGSALRCLRKVRGRDGDSLARSGITGTTEDIEDEEKVPRVAGDAEKSGTERRKRVDGGQLCVSFFPPVRCLGKFTGSSV